MDPNSPVHGSAVQRQVNLDQLPASEPCAVCNVGPAERVQEQRSVGYRRRRVEIVDDFYRCTTCSEEYYWPVQMKANEERAKAALEAQDTLAPETIRAIRERLGLTQFQFEALLGVGRNTVVRWESGQVRPNAATNTLLRLLDADPENARRLAEWHQVELGSAA